MEKLFLPLQLAWILP